MSNDMGDIRSTLNDVIETLKDGEEGYRRSAEAVSDPELRSLFQTYATERARFAADVQSEVSKIGGEPATSGSASGALHRGWISLKSAVTGRDNHSILEEAERGEDSAVKNYRDALSKDLPSDLHSLIERQYRAIQEAHNRIRALRDAGRTSASTTNTTGTPVTY